MLLRGREEEPNDSSDSGETFGEVYLRSGLRAAAAFAILFGLVFLTFWWSGAAVRFGADRASNRVQPTWKVTGTVRSAVTHLPIPWATVEDDPGGKPPLFHTDAGYAGGYELATLAERHSIRVSAPGYRPAKIEVGRVWFLWVPHGQESADVELNPE